MRTQKNLFLLCLGFFPFLLWGQIQHKPLSSPERHELSAGLSISKKSWTENLLRKSPAFFLEYALYFPEILNSIPEPYNKLFRPGLSAGVNFFKSKNEEKYRFCETTSKKPNSSAYHLGLKGKIPYFEFFQPFAEWGLARSFCHSEKFSHLFKAKKKLKSYFSYGFILSLKILDKISIYTLDQDYGINDIGIKTECKHYQPKDKADKSFSLCQFGLQISF